MPRIKRTARRPPQNDDSDDELATTTDATNNDDSDDDDDDDSPDELAQLRAKEARRRAQRRATNARYRARHPERVAAQRQSYRARHPERVAAQKRRYRANHPEREAARKRRYRARHPERVAAQNRRYRTNHPERVATQNRRYRAKKRKSIRVSDDDNDDEMAELETSQPRYRTRYACRIARGSAERQRTQEKRQALGPLSLTVRVDDFMQGFWDSLSPRTSATGPTERERTAEKVQALGPLSLTVRVGDFRQGFWDSLSPSQKVMIMDMDSGALHPLDSSCDLWDEGKGFLDNLLQESTDVPSDDSLQDVLRDLDPWSPQESDFDLEDFVS